MRRERLFLHTLDELDTRLQSLSHYDILMIVPLLRKLILDKQCLVHLINRVRRLKITFLGLTQLNVARG